MGTVLQASPMSLFFYDECCNHYEDFITYVPTEQLGIKSKSYDLFLFQHPTEIQNHMNPTCTITQHVVNLIPTNPRTFLQYGSSSRAKCKLPTIFLYSSMEFQGCLVGFLPMIRT